MESTQLYAGQYLEEWVYFAFRTHVDCIDEKIPMKYVEMWDANQDEQFISDGFDLNAEL